MTPELIFLNVAEVASEGGSGEETTGKKRSALCSGR